MSLAVLRTTSFYALVALVHFCTVPVVSQEEQLSNPCFVHQSCSACIQANPNCAWCVQEDYGENNGAPRCDLVPNLLSKKCKYEHHVYPESDLNFIRDIELSNTVQLTPQAIRLKLRPRKSFTIPIRFRQAKDYPVDLYVLMDLSNSMLDDKIKLASLGQVLATEMRDITSNFQLGFGSFVDKTVMPYISIISRKMKAPCEGCIAPYGYKHHMKLSEDTHLFEEQVNAAKISGNLDSPEGSFDAIMQSVACKAEIGWREKARKLLVVSTDASFHYAGDGKLGGIVTPNDGKCHLAMIDGELQYTESTTQDYPSLSQINRAVKDNKINIIFAVTQDQFSIYNRLSNYVEGSVAGILANDSSNVVELVKDQYNKITSSVTLMDTAPDYVKITYFSECLGTKTERTHICSGLKIGSEITWTLNVEVDKCPPGPAPHFVKFKVYPVGLEEELEINLEIICDCNCERPENEVPNSARCNGNGTYECGICSCLPGVFGRKCECTSTSISGADEERTCRQGNSTEVCTGRGRCVCGQCQCFIRDSEEENVYGSYCECDNFSCDRFGGKVCGGANQGTCECGACVCKPGWTGPACECSTSIQTCLTKDGKLCNGHGKCVCGTCECDKEADTDTPAYYGPTCESCPTCLSFCETLKDCAQCQEFGTGKLGDNKKGDNRICLEDCTWFNSTSVEELREDVPGEKVCQFQDDHDFCTFSFSYYDHPETGTLVVKVKKDKDCPKEMKAWMFILAVILGILLFGVALLLIWKVLIVIHDRRQLAKFEAELKTVGFSNNQNAIYQSPTTTYKNPIYGTK